MRVEQFCNQEVATAAPDTDIAEAARLMRSRHVGALVIVDPHAFQREPLGIVTDRDLVVEVLAQEAPIGALTVSDVMSSNLGTVSEQDDVWEAVARMSELGVRRLPVVNERGELAGILSVDDVLEWFAEAMSRLRGLIGREIWHESKTRR